MWDGGYVVSEVLLAKDDSIQWIGEDNTLNEIQQHFTLIDDCLFVTAFRKLNNT